MTTDIKKYVQNILEEMFSDQMTMADHKKATEILIEAFDNIASLPSVQFKTDLSIPESKTNSPRILEEDSSCVIYTDGACSGNPGPGGYGIILIKNGNDKEPLIYHKGFKRTTNNRMELKAVIEALKWENYIPRLITIRTDSQYVVNAINNNWLSNWAKKNFAKIANPDLWTKLYNTLEALKKIGCTVTFEWIKGHDGNKWNEMADQMAVKASKNPEYSDFEYENQK